MVYAMKRLTFFLFAIVFCFGAVSALGFHALPFMAIGYSGNFDQAPLGIFLYFNNWNYPSCYIDLKAHPDFFGAGKDYTGIVSQSTAEGFFRDPYSEHEGWMSMNFALAKEINSTIGCYAGMGLAVHRFYKTYYDRTRILDPGGNYQVTTRQDMMPNFMCGIFVFYRLSVMGQIGVETTPAGITVGLGGMMF